MCTQVWFRRSKLSDDLSSLGDFEYLTGSINVIQQLKALGFEFSCGNDDHSYMMTGLNEQLYCYFENVMSSRRHWS